MYKISNVNTYQVVVFKYLLKYHMNLLLPVQEETANTNPIIRLKSRKNLFTKFLPYELFYRKQ